MACSIFLRKKENRKGAAKPRPLCTPLGLFLGVLGCGGREFCWLVSVCDGAGNERLSRWRRTAWRGCWEWKSLETVIGMWRYWMWKVEPRVRVGGCWQVSMCGAHLRIFWNNIEVNLRGKYIKCRYIKWSNANISNANISNVNISNADISNSNISNTNISNNQM